MISIEVRIGYAFRSPAHSGSPPAFLNVLAMTTHYVFARIDAANGSDAAIHRSSKDAYGLCSSFTEGQWIATGYALAMTEVRASARQ